MSERPKVTAIDASTTDRVVSYLERSIEGAKNIRAYSAFVVLVGPEGVYVATTYPGDGRLSELIGQVEYEKQIVLRDAIAADGR